MKNENKKEIMEDLGQFISHSKKKNESEKKNIIKVCINLFYDDN